MRKWLWRIIIFGVILLVTMGGIRAYLEYSLINPVDGWINRAKTLRTKTGERDKARKFYDQIAEDCLERLNAFTDNRYYLDPPRTGEHLFAYYATLPIAERRSFYTGKELNSPRYISSKFKYCEHFFRRDPFTEIEQIDIFYNQKYPNNLREINENNFVEYLKCIESTCAVEKFHIERGCCSWEYIEYNVLDKDATKTAKRIRFEREEGGRTKLEVRYVTPNEIHEGSLNLSLSLNINEAEFSTKYKSLIEGSGYFQFPESIRSHYKNNILQSKSERPSGWIFGVPKNVFNIYE